ncbi:hypothetical protein M758_2G091500 [Ceratodon purpureus]|nr:hypothetical protein M758_2G091500 [Ceratodon purpureus]
MCVCRWSLLLFGMVCRGLIFSQDFSLSPNSRENEQSCTYAVVGKFFVRCFF